MYGRAYFGQVAFGGAPQSAAAVPGTFSLAQGQALGLVRTVTRSFSLTQAQSARLQRVALRAQSLAQGQATSVGGQQGHVASVTQTAIVSLRPTAVARKWTQTQGASPGRMRDIARAFTRTQGALATRVAGARVVALTQGAVVTRTRALATRRSLAAPPAQVALGQRVALSAVFGSAQAQTTGVNTGKQRLKSVVSAALVSRDGAVVRSWALTQAAAPTLRRRMTRIHLLTQDSLVTVQFKLPIKRGGPLTVKVRRQTKLLVEVD